MVWNNRYIDIDESGRVVTAKNTPTENSIDTEGMTVPEMPTDAIYTLYYNETEGLHYVKVADFEPVEPEPTQLDRIEETVNNIATNSTSWDAMAQAISEGVNEV